MSHLVHEDEQHHADREDRPEEQRVEEERDEHRDQRRSDLAELEDEHPVLEESRTAGGDGADDAPLPALLRRCGRVPSRRRWSGGGGGQPGTPCGIGLPAVDGRILVERASQLGHEWVDHGTRQSNESCRNRVD